MVLDLNLLISLDALLQERSVTRAAERLGLSQPTLSTALSRLRHHYHDELLSRRGNSYVLTPLAERLVEQLPEARASVDRLFDVRLAFDPATADREFTIVMSDAHQPTLGRALADLVSREAPAVRLRYTHSTELFIQQVESGLRAVDALVLPQGLISGMPSLDLYADQWACAVSADGPFSEELTLEHMREADLVLPYLRSSTTLSLVERLRGARVDVGAALIVDSFLAMPALIAGSDRIALGPRRGLTASGHPGVRIVDTPVDLGTVIETLWWHPTHERDPGHRWLRSMAALAADSE